MLALVLNCIDRLNIYNSVAHLTGIAREESGMAWKEILNLLYKLLGEYAGSAFPGEAPGLFRVGTGESTIAMEPFSQKLFFEPFDSKTASHC